MAGGLSTVEIVELQVNCLKSGTYNAAIAGYVVEKIIAAVDAGDISWQQINTNKTEIERFLSQIQVSESGLTDHPHHDLIKEFLRAWRQYRADKLSLAGFAPFFTQVDRLIGKHEIAPNLLEPGFPKGDYWDIKPQIKELTEQ